MAMRRAASFLFFSCLLLSACAKKSDQPPSPGKGLFIALGCRSCHRVGSEGSGGGPDLTLVGFRKSKDWLSLWLKDPQAWKKDTLMPNPHLAPKAREALVDYLASLKGEQYARDGRPWDKPQFVSDTLKRGHLIFTRAGCITCHGKAGAGGYPNNNVAGGAIPALSGISGKYTKEELKTKIKRGVAPEKADPRGPKPHLSMPAWGSILDDGELEAVAAYLFSLKSNHPSGDEW